MARHTVKTRLTNAVVTALIPTEGKDRAEFWDQDQAGFGVRVSSGSTKTFFVTARVNARLVRSTVGKFPALSVDEARKRARKMLVDMADGINPNDERKARRSGELTLGGVFKTFLASRKDKQKELTEKTEQHYRLVFEKHLSPWKNRHVSEITSAMCQDLHAQIGEKTPEKVTYKSEPETWTGAERTPPTRRCACCDA